MIEKAKKVYNIDFSDNKKLILEAEKEEREDQKQRLQKRISVIKMSMESNKKHFQMQMR